ncbi:MAG: formylglycine-generating enzyme family protein [Saprospiraceae bacterium]|nr:formylglycine-generating enzyme family protein [Saprospiraceae bacterium]
MDMVQQFYEEHFPLGIIMVKVAGGNFKMGSNENEREKPIHDVAVRSFYMSKYPITQKQWQTVMGNNPSKFKGDNLPVENVSWNDAQTFLKKLSDKTGQKYRLPTEAEWEFAARGGNKSNGFTYSGSDNIDEVAWYSTNSESKTHPIGKKMPNELGLYDMSGNVWEWCEDVWHETYKNAPKDGSAWTIGGKKDIRVVRGGSWVNLDDICRVSYRYYVSAVIHSYDVGFRCVRYD